MARLDRRLGRGARTACILLAYTALQGGLAGPARAEAPPAAAAARDPGPRNSASVSFFSVFGPGVTLEYERLVRPPLVSFVSGLGFRATGGDDYGSLTLTTSLEGRLWLSNLLPLRKPGERRMDGLLLALRGDVAWTSLQDHTRGRLAGTAVELAETLGLGYRFTVWRLHATPLVGGTVTTQLDPRGRLAPNTFLSGKLAITFGVLW